MYHRGEKPVIHEGVDAGVYTNIFDVVVPYYMVRFFSAPRSAVMDLKGFRELVKERGWHVRLYALGKSDKVYGYGRDMDRLRDFGFTPEYVSLKESPRLTSHLILEGIADQLIKEGYDARFGWGRLMAFPTNKFRVATPSMVEVFQGYVVKSTFRRDQFNDELTFGLVIDVAWAFKDEHGQPLSPRQVRERNAMYAVGCIQGEYLPGERRFNTEVSRQRLVEMLMPFARDHAVFKLPFGGNAELSSEPVRILIGGREE